MKTAALLLACPLMLLVTIDAASASPQARPDPVEAYIALSIQGDLSEAESLFESFPSERYPELGSLEKAFQGRFLSDEAPQTIDPENLAGQVTAAYHRYWRQGLMEPQAVRESERRLYSELGSVLGSAGESQGLNAETVRTGLETALSAQGIHLFEGAAPPLRDLFLWGAQETRSFDVQLTDGSVSVTVHFMEDFIAQGWKDFASLGLATTTGWVENGELYCLAWAYDTQSENFEVSYLQHEARHLADLARYPDMDVTELEYRAKLTELAFANLTLVRILDDFTAKASENPSSPHAMANWRVVRDVYWEIHAEELPETFEGWGAVRIGQVNRVARGLLQASNQRMEFR